MLKESEDANLINENTLKIISDLLTDICEESTATKDTNQSKPIQ